MTPVTVSYSENSTWRQCPSRWDVQYRQRWRGPETPGAASLGKLLHAMLEQAHRVDLSPQGRLARAWAVWRLSDDPRKADAERIFNRLVEYIREEYPRLGWTVVATELKFDLELPSGNRVKGAIDLVVRNRQGQLLVVDFKTSAMPYPSELRTWTQYLIYQWALRQLGYGSAEAACWFGISTKAPPVTEKAKPLEEFRLVWAGVTDAEADWAIEQLEIDIEDSWGKAQQYGESIFSPKLQYAKHPSKENCRFCPILEACDAGRRYGAEYERAMYSDVHGLVPNAERTKL